MNNRNALVRGALVFAGAFPFCLSAAVPASGVFLGYLENATNCVSENATQQGIVSLADGSTLYKTGTGTWTVPLGVFDLWNTPTIVVKNGRVVLDMDAPARLPAACPTDILNDKALLWYDTSDYAAHPERFVTRTDADGRVFLDGLYDVRETSCDPVAHARPYAEAEHVFRYVKEGYAGGSSSHTATSNNAEKILSPEIVEREGKTALWFGGVGSGRRMRILRTGKTTTDDTLDVVHVFAVHDAPLGWGPIFAPGYRTTGVWGGTAASSWNSYILHCDDGANLVGNRTYINGVRKDALSDCPVKGFSLFECEITTGSRAVSRLYQNNSAGDGNACKIAANDDGSRATAVQLGGGDYAYELICFTNRLTGAERQQVVEYLKRKWFPPTPPSVDLVAADGADCVLSTSGVATNSLPRESPMSFVKEGTGDLFFDRNTNDVAVQRVPLTLQDGKGRVVSQRPVPLTLQPGMRLTADFETNATVTVASSLEANAENGHRFVKDGKAALLVRDVPSSIKFIEVLDGTFVVNPVSSNTTASSSWVGSAGDEVYIPISNASFEERAAGDETKWGVGIASSYCGWTKLPACAAGQQCVYSVDTWGLSDPGWDGAKRSTWGFTARPHDGASALVMRHNGGVRTANALDLAAGTYELEFWTNTRSTNQGGLVDVLLIDPETNEETLIERHVQMFSAAEGFGRVPVRFNVRAARSCYLGFRCPKGYDSTQIVCVDDVRLRRIADCNLADWQIPGGNFEDIQGTAGSCMTSRLFSTALTHPNWTLTQPAGHENKTGVHLGVGFANRYMYKLGASEYPVYNDSRDPFQSQIMTFFTNGAVAVTTFTPPKGTWFLKGELAENGQNPNGKITAKATVGGVETTLGVIDPNTKIFTAFRFKDAAITVDGETPVTLALSYEVTSGINSGAKRAALYVDNLVLTPGGLSTASATARLWQWPFENFNYEGMQSMQTANDGTAGGVDYRNYPYYNCSGADPLGNTVGMFVRFNGALTWTKNFQKAGTYRISWYMSRVSSPNLPGTLPVRVWLAQNGVTNDLAVFRTGTAWKQEESVVFRIPEGPSYTYTFGFTGLVPGMSYVAQDEYGLRCQDAVLDDMTITRVDAGDLLDCDDVFPEDAELAVGEHGRLQLNFHGTNEIRRLSYKGRGFVGVVTSADHPEFLSGPGALYIPPRGTMVIFR